MIYYNILARIFILIFSFMFIFFDFTELTLFSLSFHLLLLYGNHCTLGTHLTIKSVHFSHVCLSWHFLILNILEIESLLRCRASRMWCWCLCLKWSKCTSSKERTLCRCLWWSECTPSSKEWRLLFRWCLCLWWSE